MAFNQQTMARVRSRASQWVGPAFFHCRGGESVCTPHKWGGGPWDLQIWAEECKQVRRGWRAEAERRKLVTWPLSLHKGTTPLRKKRVEKKRERMKREEDSPRKEQGMKTTFLHLQTFSLCKTSTYSLCQSLPSTCCLGQCLWVVFPLTCMCNIRTKQMCCKLNYGFWQLFESASAPVITPTTKPTSG